MMKLFKRLFKISLLCILMVAISVNIYAEGNVTYDGDAKEFIFQPGSEYSPTDLFTDFKNMMPGDSITQKVTIDNKISKEVKIKLYMRSLGANEGSEEFLSQLTLSVKQDGDSILFDAPADQTAQLTDWVYLGTVYSGGKIDLDVTVYVPLTLDNKFQDAVGHLTWEFKVEELPVEKDDPAPGTGDHSRIYLSITVMGASLLGVIVIARKKKKQLNRA